ncbi:ATP-binding cassette domain-containing protein [Streptomyces phaeochromogenes]
MSGLDFGFRKRPLFEGVSLELDPGVNFIVGANGAGKTTLFRLILGDLKPRKGSIYIPSGKVGYLPQSFGHPPRFTVEEFVTHFAWLHGVPRKDRPRAVQDAITAVGLEARAGDRMGHLSGGMLRRAGIAQALVHRPVLVLLDEPTTGLDPRQRADLRNLLVQLGESTTLVVNTHLLEDVAAIGGHIVVLDAGTIRFTGSISDLAEHGGSGSLDQAFLALTTGVTA